MRPEGLPLPPRRSALAMGSSRASNRGRDAKTEREGVLGVGSLGVLGPRTVSGLGGKAVQTGVGKSEER